MIFLRSLLQEPRVQPHLAPIYRGWDAAAGAAGSPAVFRYPLA